MDANIRLQGYQAIPISDQQGRGSTRADGLIGEHESHVGSHDHYTASSMGGAEYGPGFRKHASAFEMRGTAGGQPGVPGRAVYRPKKSRSDTPAEYTHKSSFNSCV